MTARRRIAVAAVAAVTAVGVAAVAAGTTRHQDDPSSALRPVATSATTRSVEPGAPNAGSEVVSGPDESAPASAALPAGPGGRSTTEPLLAAPPRTASRRGALVAGFPDSIVPVASGSSVRSSGVSSQRDTVQVSIVAESPRSPAAVLGFYRRALRAHDFVETAAPAAAGSVASQFARGDDRLVVTTSRVRDATSYSVYGTLRSRDRG